MAAPTPSSLLAFLQQKEFLTGEQLDELAERSQAGDAAALLHDLVRRQWLTAYQANQIAQSSANDLILGAYRILDPIGEGGMGKVYKARHVRMHRDVALKVIPPDCLENAGAVSRFYREVRAVSQLSHPNIVTAYEVGQEGKTHYFAMEFVEGIDLARLVKQSGPLPIAKACDYIRQAALGLQHAHEKGLVHRDIKPGNLIIGRSSAGGEPTVKVLDFGLARFEQAGGRATRLTKLGHVLGTVDYISPEQAGNAREADIRSDIYSLGCALFYLLTGQPPFAGSDAMERMMARVMRPAASVREARPEVPVELEAIVTKMMAREPGERFATPGEVAAALAQFASLVGATERTGSGSRTSADSISSAVGNRQKILALAKVHRAKIVASGFLAVLLIAVGIALLLPKEVTEGTPDAGDKRALLVPNKKQIPHNATGKSESNTEKKELGKEPDKKEPDKKEPDKKEPDKKEPDKKDQEKNFQLEAGFTPLFNGKNLDGWKTRKGGEALDGKTEAYKSRFKVAAGSLKDGKLVIDPKVRGDLIIDTVSEFAGDVHIKFEFLPGDGCNNDLFIRGLKFDLVKEQVKGMKLGEWNRFEIVIKDKKAEFLCNGQVARVQMVKNASSVLGVRAEFGPVEIRRMRAKTEKKE